MVPKVVLAAAPQGLTVAAMEAIMEAAVGESATGDLMARTTPPSRRHGLNLAQDPTPPLQS